jgi:hypothetical protein
MELETGITRDNKTTKILLPPTVGFILSYVFSRICELSFPSEPIDESSTPGFVFLMEYIFYLLLIISVLIFQAYYIVPKAAKDKGKGVYRLMKNGSIVIAVAAVLLIPICMKIDDSSLIDSIKVALFTAGYFGLFWLGNLFTLRNLTKKEIA